MARALDRVGDVLVRERDLQKFATDVLDRFGWQWWHVPAPMVAGRDGKWRPYAKAAGLPDIVAMHDDPPPPFWEDEP